MFRLRARRKKYLLPISTDSVRKKSKVEARCLSWSNVAMGALIPVSVLIVTIVFTLQQQTLDDRRRKQDQDLANLTRIKDLEIADLTRMQDQRQADDLYFQGVFKTYIEDISNILFKQQNGSFIDNRTKLDYIRSQTLTAFRVLDWDRKTEILIFLHENNLLPRTSSSYNESITNPSLDLSCANLVNISLTSSSIRIFHFNRLALPFVDLTNASLVGSVFHDGTNFSGSVMNGIKLKASEFMCSRDYHGGYPTLGVTHTYFDGTSLERADFSDSLFCDIICNRTNLAYADFTRTVFEGNITLIGTNLTQANFTASRVHFPFSMNIINAKMTNIVIENSDLDKEIRDGRVKMTNVILPNGTWLISHTNLILNGDAEIDCSSSSNKTHFTNWEKFYNVLYPTLALNKNSSTDFSGKCYFNFTSHNTAMSMHQKIDVGGLSFFIDSDEAIYNLTMHVACTHSYFEVDMYFYSAELAELSSTKHTFYREKLEWAVDARSSAIPAYTRQITIRVTHWEETCYADNIELYIMRKAS